jgi:hypothetical protein
MKKISLKNVKETLSRKEMKSISGGSGGFWKDAFYGTVLNWTVGVMWDDYKSRSGGAYSASGRAASMGPY